MLPGELEMRYWFLLILLLFAGSVGACISSLHSSPTPPDGFVNLHDLTPPEQFLKLPALNANGQYLAAMGGLSIEEAGHGSLFVIDTNSEEVVFSTEKKAWVSLSISPDGQQIAACADQQIFIINWVNNETTYLTEGCWPTWSSDGQNLAYVLYTTEHKQILSRNLATENEEVVYEAPPTTEFIGYLDWSTAQDKLAFVMPVNSILYKLHIINVNGSDLRRITGASQDVVSPNFSPEGTRLIYVNWNIPTGTDNQYLEVIDLNGHCHRLESPVPGLRHISLSSEGNKIAFGTIYGILMTDTETAFGKDFWETGKPCDNS
jgi:Tol biopolymer transport system component